MKQLSVYLLAFLTFWMSTWMVTDIHNLSNTDFKQSYSDSPLAKAHYVFDLKTVKHDHETHCGVCSYDHGGHMGQTLTTESHVVVFIPAQNAIISPHPYFSYSNTTIPKLRPPIA